MSKKTEREKRRSARGNASPSYENSALASRNRSYTGEGFIPVGYLPSGTEPSKIVFPLDRSSKRKIIALLEENSSHNSRGFKNRLFLKSKGEKLKASDVSRSFETLRNQENTNESTARQNYSDALAGVIDRLYKLLEGNLEPKIQAEIMLAIQEVEQKNEAIRLDGKPAPKVKALEHFFDKLQSSFSPKLMPDRQS